MRSKGDETMSNCRENTPARTRESREAPVAQFLPRVDIVDGDNRVVIEAEMPGVDENGVQVTLDGDVLTLEGKIRQDPRGSFKQRLGEYEEGHYRRTFTISKEIDRDNVEAKLKDGILYLTLAKQGSAGPRTIQVKGD
jgi:HSP20 family protein